MQCCNVVLQRIILITTHMKTGVPVYISKGALVIYWLMFTFWFLGVYPFLIQLDSYQLFLNVDGNVTIFFEGCYIALGLLLLRNRWDKAVVYGFIAIAFISTVLVNGLPVKEWLNGLRFYAPMVFLLPVVRYGAMYVVSVDCLRWLGLWRRFAWFLSVWFDFRTDLCHIVLSDAPPLGLFKELFQESCK